jgi:hypothetical protein
VEADGEDVDESGLVGQDWVDGRVFASAGINLV